MYIKKTGTRILAFSIDLIMIFMLAGLFNLLFDFGTLVKDGTNYQFNLNLFEITFVSLIYFIAFVFINRGRTIGKLILNLEIKTTNLEDVTFKKILIRELCKSLLMVVNIISFIFVLVNKDKKSIHDLIVDTIVVKEVKANEIIYNNKSVDSVDVID